MEVSLATPLVSRDGSLAKDAKLLNCFWESNSQGQRQIVARSGTKAVATPAVGQGQGMFTDDMARDWVIIGDTAYGILSNAGAPTAAFTGAAVANSRLSCLSASKYLTTSGSSLAVVKSINEAWVASGSTSGPTGITIVKVASANYPATTVPGIAWLDGSYYVLTPWGSLFGSAINDPQTWTALNVIAADSGLGLPVAVGRHLNYVVAYCLRGVQFFFDNANPAPGSPLSPAQNATSTIGCAHADSIQKFGDDTIFMSLSASGAPSVSIIRGLSVSPLSDESVDRILAANPIDTGYTQLYSLVVKVGGHPFYLLTMFDFTLACDLSTGSWSQWSSWDGANDHAFLAGFAFPPSQNAGVAKTALLARTTGQVLSLGNAAPDETVHVLVRTRPLDAGGTSRKTLSELGLLSDTVNATMNVRYSNDDCQTWSDQRPIDLSLPRKRLTRLGSFFRRVFEFSCLLTNQVLRVESMVLPDRNLPAQAAPQPE